MQKYTPKIQEKQKYPTIQQKYYKILKIYYKIQAIQEILEKYVANKKNYKKYTGVVLTNNNKSTTQEHVFLSKY